MSQCQCSAQQSVTVPGYLSPAGCRILSETLAQKKARRRACERKVKPHDQMISDWAISNGRMAKLVWSDSGMNTNSLHQGFRINGCGRV